MIGGPATGGDRPSAVSLGVWTLAWPNMMSFGLQAVVGFVDLLIVGALGGEAVASVGVAQQISFAIFSILTAVTTGTVALVARAVGGGRWPEADRVLRLSALLAGGLAAACMLVMPWTENVVGIFGLEPAVVERGGRYLRILLWFNVPLALNLVLGSGLRGAGDVRTPLVIGAVVNVLNVFLNYGLVYGRFGMPELGTDGSALGSGLAYSVGTLIMFWLWGRNLLVIPRGPWRDGLTWVRSRAILHVGIPTALEQIAFQSGLWIFLRVVAEFGTEPVSAYLIGVRMLSLSFIPGLGFSMAASALVGQHLGAGSPERATQAGWRATWACVGVMSAVGLTVILTSGPVAAWFGAAGERTVELTVVFIYILGSAQPLMAMEFALGGALRGAGDTRFPLFSMLMGLFAVRLTGAFIVWQVFDGSVVQVWSCLLADYAVKALLLSQRFRSGRWQTLPVGAAG